MKFRPCIDLHNGVVKQIVGSTLSECTDSTPEENFAASAPASEFASRYRDDGLTGGHVIMLGPNCEAAAAEALRAYPQGLQIGGGITTANAMGYIENGAAQVIVTSFVFRDGTIDFERLQALKDLVGKERLVIDLSCRRKPIAAATATTTTTTTASDGGDTNIGSSSSGSSSSIDSSRSCSDEYYVVTNKWTKFTDFVVTVENLQLLSAYCAEFLVHGVDVEGRRCGIEQPLVALLGAFASQQQQQQQQQLAVTVTYAGGIRSIEDLQLVQELGKNAVDCTVGSALDIFGGELPYKEVLEWHRSQQQSY